MKNSYNFHLNDFDVTFSFPEGGEVYILEIKGLDYHFEVSCLDIGGLEDFCQTVVYIANPEKYKSETLFKHHNEHYVGQILSADETLVIEDQKFLTFNYRGKGKSSFNYHSNGVDFESGDLEDSNNYLEGTFLCILSMINPHTYNALYEAHEECDG